MINNLLYVLFQNFATSWYTSCQRCRNKSLPCPVSFPQWPQPQPVLLEITKYNKIWSEHHHHHYPYPVSKAEEHVNTTGVSGNSRSRPFPRMKASDSLSRIMGMDFFHSLPVPEFRECFFFIPFLFPNYGNGFFSFPSRSRIVGMDFCRTPTEGPT